MKYSDSAFGSVYVLCRFLYQDGGCGTGADVKKVLVIETDIW